MENSIIIEYDYTISLDEKPSKTTFWDYVESAEEVYKFSMKLNALNIGIGNSDVRDALDALNKQFNNDEVIIELKNQDGNLEIPKSVVGRYIEYVSQVGGKYSLSIKDTVRRSIDSLSNALKLRLRSDIKEEDIKSLRNKIEEISEPTGDEKGD
jgi:hypothetical protein